MQILGLQVVPRGHGVSHERREEQVDRVQEAHRQHGQDQRVRLGDETKGAVAGVTSG